MPPIVSRAVLRIVAGIWIGLLIIGSLQPVRPGIVTGHHRQVHWAAFAGAALMLLSLARTRRQEALAALAMVMLGISIEVLQHLIYRHPMEWRDIADDSIAVAAGLALYYLTGSRKPSPTALCPKP